MNFLGFMFCMAIGLVGLCMVLMTLIESVFSDWDILADIRLILQDPSVLRDAMRREGQGRGRNLDRAPERLATRLDPYGRADRESEKALADAAS